MAKNNPGARTDAYRVDPFKLVIVGLDTEDTKDHELYDERIMFPVSESMVRNIMEHGVIASVLARRNGPGTFEVIDGRQRIRAAREATLRMRKDGRLTDEEAVLVPTQLRRDDAASLAVAVVVTNEHRQEDAPMNRARKAMRLQNLGKANDQIAEAFNVSVQTVKNWLALLDLSPKVQKAVDAGKISASAAAPLAKMARKDQGEKLKELIEAAPAQKRVTRAVVERNVDPNAVRAPAKSAFKKLLKDEASLLTLDQAEVELVRYFTTGEVSDSPCGAVVNIKALVEAFGG